MNDLRKFIRLILENDDDHDDSSVPDHKKITGATDWNRLHGTAHRMPDERYAIMMKKGNISKEAAIQADKLLTRHGISSENDHIMIDHIDANDEIGIALRKHAEMETNVYLKWKNKRDERRKFFDQKIETMKKKWENPPYAETYKDVDAYIKQSRDFMLMDIGFNEHSEGREGTFQDIVDYLEKEYSEQDEPILVYRKTSKNDAERRIQAWTTHSNGAWTGNGGRIKPNKSSTVDALLDQGWMILGGIVRMMGASGEGEITFVKL